jgi:hypothetical protein
MVTERSRGKCEMPWTISHVPEKPLLTVKTSGTLEKSSLRSMTADLCETLRQQPCKGVLIDYSAAVIRLHLHELYDRPKVIEELGFPREVKVAILFPEVNADAQFLENVYVNAGFPVRVFQDSKAALEWLEG